MKLSVWTGWFVFMIFTGFCSAFLIKSFCILL